MGDEVNRSAKQWHTEWAGSSRHHLKRKEKQIEIRSSLLKNMYAEKIDRK
jgi:hypothetical protein